MAAACILYCWPPVFYFGGCQVIVGGWPLSATIGIGRFWQKYIIGISKIQNSHIGTLLTWIMQQHYTQDIATAIATFIYMVAYLSNVSSRITFCDRVLIHYMALFLFASNTNVSWFQVALWTVSSQILHQHCTDNSIPCHLATVYCI